MMNRLLLATTIAVSLLSTTHATPYPDKDHCSWKDKVVKEGDSLWVEDAVLTAAGASRDWRGFRLVCAPMFKSSSSANYNVVGGELEKIGVGFVLSDNSSDFFRDLEGKLLSEIAKEKQ